MRNCNCILCGSNKAETILTYRGYSMVECKHCRLVYQNPRHDQAELNRLYKTYHIRNDKGPENWWNLMKRIFKNTSLLISRYYPDGGSVLDIGCGYGHFLWIMKQKNWVVHGVDPSPETVMYARAKGLRVFEGNFEEFDMQPASFNVITMFYVLEHLLDPISALKKAWDLLKTGGMLVIRVPHTTPIIKLLKVFHIQNNLYDLPFHIYDYSPKTLRELLKKAGFTDVKVFTGHPTSPPALLTKLFSIFFGYVAYFIDKVSFSKILVPGVSKTAVAFKKES